MLRTYRIERAQGFEFVIQETYRNYTWTKEENDMFSNLIKNETDTSVIAEKRRQFIEDNQIPVHDHFPAVVVRGALVENKIVEISASYVPSVLYPEVQSEINKFYGIFDSRHWRNMIACQRDSYGSLFGSDND